MGEELLHQVALCMTPGIGSLAARKLISYCGSASDVFKSDYRQLIKVPGVGEITARALLQKSPLARAEKEIQQARLMGIKLLFFNHPQYPRRLSQLPEAPLLLYTKGEADLQHHHTIAVVGTRKITAYGHEAIAKLFQCWQPYHPVIISGLAYGVDIAAHRQALQFGLPTWAILGSGLDKIYPAVHYNTACKIYDQGSLISELPLGTPPDFYHFPKRNRIIAGLCDALVVVEAKSSGGALITAALAQSYRRPVFALPGPITSPTSVGCLRLIHTNQASILVDGQELPEYLGWSQAQAPPSPTPTTHLKGEAAEIIELLKSCPQGLHIDEISWKTQTPINKTGSLLLTMEFEGLVRCLPGKKFSLVNK